MAFEVGAGDRAPDLVKIRSDLTSDIALVEVIEAGAGEMFQGCGEHGLFEHRARLRGLATDEKRFGEARNILELGVLFGRELRVAPHHDAALTRQTDGMVEQDV